MNPDHHMSELIGEKNRQPETVDICYIHAVSKASSEVVISFFKRANPFPGICLFCIFARNKIYVTDIEMLRPVVLARYLHSEGFD
jgi:hypothetical protein